MFDRLLTLQLVSSKNCFCYLSANNIKELQGKAVKLSYGNNNQAYLSVDSSVKITDDQVIAISSLYGRALGLKDNEAVTVSEISAVPNIQSLTIYPLSMDDYDVVEMLAETIQSTLLTQVRILSNDQKVVIWIGKLYVTVNVCDIKPMSPGRIDNLVEVTIKKPNEIRKNRDSDFLNTLDKLQSNPKIPSSTKANSIFKSYLKNKSPTVFRLASISLSKHNHLDEFEHPFNIFLFKNQLPLELCESSLKSGQIFCMKPLCTLDNNRDKSIYVQLHILENSNVPQTDKSNIFTNLYVNNEILKFFNCPVGARVKLEPDNTFPDVQHVEIFSKNHKTLNNIETFKRYLGQNCKTHPAVLNGDFVFNIAKGVRCYVKFQPEIHRFCLVTGDFIRNCKFSVNYEATFPIDSLASKTESKCITNISNFEDIVHSSSVVADTTINGRMNSFLITGGVGRGKTTLLNIIENKFSTESAQIYTKKIDCKTLKGKTLESFNKFLTTTLMELVHFQPSILLLDDVNVLCQDESASEGAPHNMVYFNRISEMLEGLLNTYSKHNLIGIVMTCESAYKLNKNIYGSRGNHFFKLVYSLDNLNKTDRRKILEHLFSGHHLESVSLDTLADKMESFVFQDIKDFANKALYESYEEDYSQDSLVLNEEICQRALEATTVTTLHDINLSSSGSKDFSDVGGLEEIKSVLIETLFWPSKYSNLFSHSPLRLPSGLLLYGPPGTGKTLIAAAAATQCSLRLISVKGPELLSKYIGASEQAVRDVFQKAQGAKPCILFFDEFDSLAPRRGHDNTGVTDRVVNQLLTQLDGVESLSGVFVLAATSRPDLLDPALLRPGRLDRHVFCPLPNRESRLSILQALSVSMKFSSDVDLEKIADRTEGFSGADIQSLLYTAQLSTVDDLLSDEVTSEEVISEINQNQLEEALKKTKPSVTRQERKKFERIYKKFRSGGIENFAAGSRATLA